MNQRASIDEIKTARLAGAMDAIHEALTASTTEPLYTLSPKLAQGMAEEEIGFLAFAALRAVGSQTLEAVISAALEPSQGPLPPLDDNPKACARMWAENAAQRELMAYAGASVRQMSAENRAKFKSWLGDQDA